VNGDIQNFIERCVAQYPMAGRVLDIGSRDICGSARRWFTKDGQQKEPTERFPEYIGIDIYHGNLVDIVMDAHDLTRGLGSFDVVISTSAMEHDSDPFKTMDGIAQVLRPGGYFIFTAPSWRGEVPHDQHDYWRFMVEGVELLFKRANIEILELIDHAPSNDVMAIGVKR